MKRASLALGAAALLGASGAAAQDIPRELRLDVQGDRCITAERLREAVAVVHGADPFRPGAPALLRVHVVAGSSLGRARWQVLAAGGTAIREGTVTEVGGCADLLRALALSFTIAYESSAPPSPPPAPMCDAPCRAAIRAELCRENPRSCTNVDIVPVLLAGGALSVGLTADPGGGAWLGGELRFGEIFSTALEARVLFPSRVVPTADEPFALSMVSFGLVPCGRWKWLLGCVSADIGMFIGGGIYAPSGLPILATFGVGPRVGGQIPITERLGIRAFADLRIAPVPTRFGFQDSPGTWESNPVSGFFGVGLTFE